MSKKVQQLLKLFLILAVAAMIMLSGCQPNIEMTSSATPTMEWTETTTSEPTATTTPTLTPTPIPMNGQQTQYFIDATVDYYNRYITATSRSVYTNKTNTPINEMVFIVYPTIFQNAIYIKSVELGDGTPITNYRWESHRMVIPLENPLMPGEQITFTQVFELYMPDRKGIFGQTGRQLNLAYWFPFIPPRTEEGWMIYEISLVNSKFVGEHLVYESADFDLNLEFSNRRENFKIAAGAKPDEAEGIIHYHLPLARTLTLSISDAYTITERETQGVKVLSYTFPEEAPAGETAAEIAVDAINLFTEYFGPVDKDLVSIVEVEFEHNMEFDGIVMLNSGLFMFYNGTPKTNLTILTPHELSHQWFFSLVGNDQAMEPWLDESLATYSEVLFYERYYPDLVPWWWENRVDNYIPYGYVDNSIYLESGYEGYRNSVYLNGAHFVQDLRDTIGDEAFFSFLMAYVQTYRYKIASGADFWSLLKQHTNEDLTPLIDEYFSDASKIP